MKRWMVGSLFMLTVVVGVAAGADSGSRLGCGFRSSDVGALNATELRIGAPIGVRWWANEQVGLDLGFGLKSHKDVAAAENTTDWSIEGGIPFRIKSWDRVHVILRPGVNYTQQEDFVSSGPTTFEKIKDKFITVTGELEAEVFLVDNVSISASHGIGFVNYKPGEADAKSTTDFATFGNNFTQLGFHVYMGGSK